MLFVTFTFSLKIMCKPQVFPRATEVSSSSHILHPMHGLKTKPTGQWRLKMEPLGGNCYSFRRSHKSMTLTKRWIQRQHVFSTSQKDVYRDSMHSLPLSITTWTHSKKDAVSGMETVYLVEYLLRGNQAPLKTGYLQTRKRALTSPTYCHMRQGTQQHDISRKSPSKEEACHLFFYF